MEIRFDSITYGTQSPERMRDFYVNALSCKNMPELSEPPGFCIVQTSACKLIFQQMAEPQTAGQKSALLEIGMEVSDVQLAKANVLINGGSIVNDEQQMGWGDAFTAADPDGNSINIYKFSNRK
jgi:predicted enzyme related to lactoylglutathione lyase